MIITVHNITDRSKKIRTQNVTIGGAVIAPGRCVGIPSEVLNDKYRNLNGLSIFIGDINKLKVEKEVSKMMSNGQIKKRLLSMDESALDELLTGVTPELSFDNSKLGKFGALFQAITGGSSILDPKMFKWTGKVSVSADGDYR